MGNERMISANYKAEVWRKPVMRAHISEDA